MISHVKNRLKNDLIFIHVCVCENCHIWTTVHYSWVKLHTLSLKRNTSFLRGFFLGPRVRIMWPWITGNLHIAFLNNFPKTASKNMKRFSDYASKTEHTSSLWFRKTVNSLLIIMNFWFFKKQVKEKHTSPSLHSLGFDYVHLSTCVKHFSG